VSTDVNRHHPHQLERLTKVNISTLTQKLDVF
jgi:hypothetical protein